MKTLTIRGIDEQLSKKIKSAAKKEKASVNQFILDILRKEFGQLKKKEFTKTYHDLDTLSGAWTKDEYRIIRDQTDQHRHIDEELWK